MLKGDNMDLSLCLFANNNALNGKSAKSIIKSKSA